LQFSLVANANDGIQGKAYIVQQTNQQISMILHGTAHAYGDNIDTDRIIPGKYTKTLDLSSLAAHVMEA
jgi:hypothetical protein